MPRRNRNARPNRYGPGFWQLVRITHRMRYRRHTPRWVVAWR